PEDDANTVSNPWFLKARNLFLLGIVLQLQMNYIKDDNQIQILTPQVVKAQSDLFKYSESLKHVDMDYAVDR
ncbi:MAG: hypothetical protein ACREGC_04180, partial [Minisyncoccia bacterium]